MPAARRPAPAEAEPTDEAYCFARAARKDSGGDGRADVVICTTWMPTR